MPTPYQGNSIIDYLKSTGGDSSYTNRAKLAAEKGIQNYSGTSEQNTQLLGLLNNTGGNAGGNTSLVGTSDPSYANKDAEAAKALTDAQKKQDEVAKLSYDAQIKALKEQLMPPIDVQKPNLAGDYKQLISEKDGSGSSISDYQQNIVNLNSEKADAIAQLNAFKKKQVGVEEGYSQGIISKEQQAVQDKVDFIDRQINTLNLQVKNRSDIISTIMDLEKTDYTNAVNSYNDAFTKNVAVQNLLNTGSNAQDKIKDNARANLNIIYGQMEKGSTSYADLSDAQKNMITSLEQQAGMPTGISEFIKANVKGDVVSTSSRTTSGGAEYFDILSKDKNGKMTVTSVYAGQGKVTTPVDTTDDKKHAKLEQDAKDTAKRIDSSFGQYSYQTGFNDLKARYPWADDDTIYAQLGSDYLKK